MQALKALLVIMGVIIVAGFAFIGWEVYKRATDPNHPRSFARKEQAVPGQVPVRPALPAGSRIGQIQPVGTRVVYHVTLPDGTEQIHVLDPRSGEVTVPVTTGSMMGDPAPANP